MLERIVLDWRCGHPAIRSLDTVRCRRRIMRHAQMFPRHIGRCGDLANLVDRQFSGQHHTLDPQLPGDFDRFCAGHGHLGAGVDRKIGANFPNESRSAEVLHQDGVDSAGRDVSYIFFEARSSSVKTKVLSVT